jgi:hypothetical protein
MEGLLEDEIHYELYIRGAERSTGATDAGAEMERIRGLIAADKWEVSAAHVKYLVPESELLVCKDKFNQIYAGLNVFDLSPGESKILFNRLVHVYSRLSRILDIDSVSDTILKLSADKLADIERMFRRFFPENENICPTDSGRISVPQIGDSRAVHASDDEDSEPLGAMALPTAFLSRNVITTTPVVVPTPTVSWSAVAPAVSVSGDSVSLSASYKSVFAKSNVTAASVASGTVRTSSNRQSLFSNMSHMPTIQSVENPFNLSRTFTPTPCNSPIEEENPSDFLRFGAVVPNATSGVDNALNESSPLAILRPHERVRLDGSRRIMEQLRRRSRTSAGSSKTPTRPATIYQPTERPVVSASTAPPISNFTHFGSDGPNSYNLGAASTGGPRMSNFGYLQPMNSGSHDRRPSPMIKWNCKYAGDENKFGLCDFLGKIELLADAEGLSDADLRRGAVYLFTGRAEVWFESFGANHPTWNGMIGAMKRSFLGREHDFMTLQEIQSRPQQRNENFEVYWAEMNRRFRRLSYDVPNFQKLEIFRRNLRSVYRQALVHSPADTFEQLVSVCLRVDEADDLWYNQSVRGSAVRGAHIAAVDAQPREHNFARDNHQSTQDRWRQQPTGNWNRQGHDNEIARVRNSSNDYRYGNNNYQQRNGNQDRIGRENNSGRAGNVSNNNQRYGNGNNSANNNYHRQSGGNMSNYSRDFDRGQSGQHRGWSRSGSGHANRDEQRQDHPSWRRNNGPHFRGDTSAHRGSEGVSGRNGRDDRNSSSSRSPGTNTGSTTQSVQTDPIISNAPPLMVAKPPVVSFRAMQTNGPEICFNCGGLYHNYQVCSAPRSLFCTHCGNRGVNFDNCKICSGNGSRVPGSTGTR